MEKIYILTSSFWNAPSQFTLSLLFLVCTTSCQLTKETFLDRPGKKVIHISNKIHNRFCPFPYTLESKAGVIKNIKEEKQVIGNCFKKMVFPHQKYV